jgi:putative ABC transport system permease protein
MITTLRIAFRNTRRQRKRSFLLSGAIAFGIVVITLVNAFTAGMIENIKANFVYLFGGHVFITGTELSPSGRVISLIGDDALVKEALALVEGSYSHVNRRSQTVVEFIFGSKTNTFTLEGVDWESETQLPTRLQVLAGSLDNLQDPQALVLPEQAADKLGVVVGETVLARLETVSGQLNIGEFQVVAIVKDQTNFGISSSYGSIVYLNELLGLPPDGYQTLQVFLRDINTMDQVSDILYEHFANHAEVNRRLNLNFEARTEDEREDYVREQREAIAALLGGYTELEEPWQGTKFAVTTLNDIMSPVVSMIDVLSMVALVVFIILLIITMVGITNTFRMILIERTQEIGTMRAFGMQRGGVRNIFLLEAVIIGLMGVAAGFVAAGVIMLVLSSVTFTEVSVLQFFLKNGHFMFKIALSDILTNIAILLIMTLIAAWMPARAAAKLPPAEALRAAY